MEQGDAVPKRRLDAAPGSYAELAQLLQEGLRARLRGLLGPDSFNRVTGNLLNWQAGLASEPHGDVPGLHRQSLRQGLQRPDSCMALAATSFLPWAPHPDRLALCGLEDFTEIHFDGRCPTGVRGTPPHIEVLASGPSGVVGVTVRVFDYLIQRRTRPSPAYRSLELPARMVPWAALLPEADSDQRVFRHVDILTLAKLALGLGRIFAHRPTRLLYLYLEPARSSQLAPFAAHRQELARLVDGTRDSAVPLTAVSFRELWAGWRRGRAPQSVRAATAELRRRYAVAMPRAISL